MALFKIPVVKTIHGYIEVESDNEDELFVDLDASSYDIQVESSNIDIDEDNIEEI